MKRLLLPLLAALALPTAVNAGVDPSTILLQIEAEAAATFYYPEQIASLINQCLDKNKT